MSTYTWDELAAGISRLRLHAEDELRRALELEGVDATVPSLVLIHGEPDGDPDQPRDHAPIGNRPSLALIQGGL